MSRFSNFELSPIQAPCRDCNKRQLHCHSFCKEYLEFDAKNDARRVEKQKNTHISDTLYSNTLNRHARLKRESNKVKHRRAQ